MPELKIYLNVGAIMPEFAQKNHSFCEWKESKNNEIARENIRVIDNRPHVTLRWISARFRITYTLLQCALVEIEQQTPVYADDQDFWIDDAAFIEICNHPALSNTFGETAQMAMLHLLGHYRQVAA